MYKDLTYEKANEMIETNDVVIIDVRTEDEYITGHLKGAINIPLDEIEDRACELESKNKNLIVYCKSGIRSLRACELLAKLGYTNIYNLGGVVGWPYGLE